MAGRHRLKGRQVQHNSRRCAIEVVNARTLTAHFMTTDALVAGRLPEGRYTAFCGQDVSPACLTEPGSSRARPVSRSPVRDRDRHEVEREAPAYGYLRVTDELDDEEIRRLELGLEKLAEAEGLCLAETCYEYQPGYYGTFSQLT
jgi:hypothetical protein